MKISKISRVIALAMVITTAAAVPAFAAAGQQTQTQQNQMMMQMQGQTQTQMQGQTQTQTQGQTQQTRTTATQTIGTAAQYIINQGIMSGDGKGNYNLSGSLKRGDLMIMIVNAFKLTSQSSGSSFSDVSSGSYYASAISTTKNLGIAMGDGKNFNPESAVTIQEAILFIERAAEEAGIDLDVDLESLYDSGELTQNATREDVAAMLYYALTGSTDGFSGYTGTVVDYTNSTMTTITYTTDEEEAVTFDDADFSEVFADATDEDLSYVIFTLPSSTSGKLYYGYEDEDSYDSKVTASTKYYVDEDPYLSDVTFVPADNYDGTVKISYTGYDEDGNSAKGTITITVSDSDITAETITYTTDEGEEITFDESDLSDACEAATDEDLSYVTFTLPSSTAGKLYYDYEDEDNYDSKVTASTKYYVDEDPYLSEITFVPTDDYDGTVTISYTGYTDEGTAFTGKIKVTVD